MAAVMAFALALPGCSLKDSSVSPDKSLPMTDGASENVHPQVAAVAALDNTVPNISTTGQVTATTTNFRLVVTFSEPMDADTINTSNIYVRDVTAAPVIVPGQSVTLSKSATVVWIDWASATDYTAVPLEVVVTRDVTDRSGNGVAGLVVHHANAYPWDQMAADFRQEVTGAGAWAVAPNWDLATVNITAADASPTLINVTVTFDTINILATSVSQANFTVTSGTIANYVATNLNTTGVITFDITNPTADSMGTITFNPAGVLIDPSTAGNTRRYPDGATTLLTLTSGYVTPGGDESTNEVVDDALEGTLSTFIYRYVPDTAITSLPEVNGGSAVDRTGNFYSGVGADRIWEIQFDDASAAPGTLIAMNPATFIPDNFIAYNAAGDELQITVTPFYLTGDAACSRALISTMDYSQDAISSLVIRTGVRSAGGQHMDGDGDGKLEGENDVDTGKNPVTNVGVPDGEVDDWVTL